VNSVNRYSPALGRAPLIHHCSNVLRSIQLFSSVCRPRHVPGRNACVSVHAHGATFLPENLPTGWAKVCVAARLSAKRTQLVITQFKAKLLKRLFTIYLSFGYSTYRITSKIRSTIQVRSNKFIASLHLRSLLLKFSITLD
jgi:hypothetical protein